MTRLWALLLPIGIFLHTLWGTFFCYLYFIGNDKKELDTLLSKSPIPLAQETLDAISYAQEVGRLDIISLILAMFGIILAITALGWFGYIRREAIEEARDEINKTGIVIIKEYLNKNPDIITRAIQDSSISSKQYANLSDGIDDTIADNIAGSMGGDDNE